MSRRANEMSAGRHIEFVLPLHARIPCGGVKVVFEYANRFAADGWKVTVAMSAAVGWKRMNLIAKLRALPYYIYCLLIRSNRYPKWFSLDSRVKCVSVFLPHYKLLPKADVYVVCGPASAQYVPSYPDSAKKVYFIQHHDNWNMPDALINDTYRFPVRKFVIARWLRSLVETCGGDDIVDVPNGFDFSVFKVTNPIATRDPYVISLMYHPLALKGYNDALTALKTVKESIPLLRLNIFGAYAPPKDIPDWATYVQSPCGVPLADIYNKSAIYVSASRSEGWGLTVGEAMACGAAVCCTACDGHLEMVVSDVSGLTSPIGDTRALAENLIRLIRDDALRIAIAEAGAHQIARFTWDASYERMRLAILENL